MAFRYVLFNLLIALSTISSVGAHQPIPDAALHTIPNLVVSCSSDSDCAPDEYCNKVCSWSHPYRSFTGCAVVCVTKKSIPIQQMFETAIFKRFYLTHHVVPVGIAEPHWLKNEMAVMEALNNELAASEDEKDGSSATQQLEDDSLLPVVSELKKPLSITHVKVSESTISSARADHVIDAHTSKDEDIEASGLDLETGSGEVISATAKAEESSAVEAHTEASGYDSIDEIIPLQSVKQSLASSAKIDTDMEEASGNDPEDITADTVPSAVSMEKLITDVDDNNNESEASEYVLKEDVNEISNAEQSTTEASGIDTDSNEYETAEASGEYLSEGVRDQSRLGGMKEEANEPLNGQNSVVTSTDINGDSDLEGSGYGQNELSLNEQSYARNEGTELDSSIESAEASGDELDGSDQIGKPEFKIDTEEGSGGHGLVVVDHSVGAKMAVEAKEASGHDFNGSDALQMKPAMKVDVDDEVLDEGFITLPKNVPEIKKTGEPSSIVQKWKEEFHENVIPSTSNITLEEIPISKRTVLPSLRKKSECPPAKICKRGCGISIDENGCQSCQCIWKSSSCSNEEPCTDLKQICDFGRCQCKFGYIQDMTRPGECKADPSFPEYSVVLTDKNVRDGQVNSRRISQASSQIEDTKKITLPVEDIRKKRESGVHTSTKRTRGERL